MKFAVDRSLDAKKYEEAPIGQSLQRVLKYWTMGGKFTGVDQRMIMKHTDALFGKGNGVIFTGRTTEAPFPSTTYMDPIAVNLRYLQLHKYESVVNSYNLRAAPFSIGILCAFCIGYSLECKGKDARAASIWSGHGDDFTAGS